MSPREFTPAAPTVPQPRLPRNDAYQGSVITGALRPRFVWEPSTAQRDPIVYELQFSPDPKLETDVTTVKTSELTYQPPEPLAVSTVPPVGRRYYWRVRACLEESCSEYSRPWWVNLGRSAKDLNGDGYADVVVGAPTAANGAGKVLVFYGGPGQVLDRIIDGNLDNPVSGGRRFGYRVADGGDFNGDGFADLAVSGTDTVYVYLGGAVPTFNSGIDYQFIGSTGDGFGDAVSFVGDTNGDTRADLLIGSPKYSMTTPMIGRADLFYGAAGPRLTAPDITVTGLSANEGFGGNLSGGDIDGDGLAEWVVSAGGFADDFRPVPCVARVYRGAPTAIAAVARTFIESPSNAMCSIKVIVLGDINGDGFADPVVALNESGPTFSPYLGSPTMDQGAIGKIALGRAFSSYISGLGDVNGDGHDDMAIGGEYPTHLYFGGGVTSAGLVFAGLLEEGFGPRGGDVNGDGIGDAIVHSNNIYLYLGTRGPTFDSVVDTEIILSGFLSASHLP